MQAATGAAESLGQAWARNLLIAFYASLDYARMPGDMARRVAASATFLAALNNALIGCEEINQVALLDIHGAEGLRRQERLVTFLVKQLGLTWNSKVAVSHSARRVTSMGLSNSIGKSWYEDLVAFSKALARSKRPLSDRTVKSYVGAARGLLDAAGIERASNLTERHVKAWLRRRPGRTNDVLRFMKWLGESGGPKITVRLRSGKTPRARERATLTKAKTLVAQISACQNERKGRALLARSIATIHGVRLEKVLALSRNNVARLANNIELMIDDTNVLLCPILSNAFLQFTDDSAGLLFAGR